MIKKRKCKITVIRKECFIDLQEQYLADPKSGPCSMFEVGQDKGIVNYEGIKKC